MTKEIRQRNSRRRPAGFTLIEILVVIVILLLLVSILLPSLRSALNASYAARTLARIQTLTGGIMGYYNDNNHLYPGQRGTDDLLDGDPYDTGSVLLAHAMFTDDSKTPAFPQTGYLDWSEDWIAGGLLADTISDGFPGNTAVDQRAICYYVSRVGETGLAQFVEGDNDAYTNPNLATPPPMTFAEFITDGRFSGTKPYKDGQFLLIAPGVDRLYFTDDDLKNW